VEDSLRRFVERTLNLDGNGRDMRAVEDQLGRLSVSNMSLTTIPNWLRTIAERKKA
jgi:hypothetical protein